MRSVLVLEGLAVVLVLILVLEGLVLVLVLVLGGSVLVNITALKTHAYHAIINTVTTDRS